MLGVKNKGAAAAALVCVAVVAVLSTLMFVKLNPGSDITKSVANYWAGGEVLEVRACASEKSRRVVVWFGTRPEVIKMAPIIVDLDTDPEFHVYSVFTGQHADLMTPFVHFFGIKINKTLHNIMAPDSSVASLFARVTTAIENTIVSCPSDIWLVQGDTTSAAAAAMVGFTRGLTVGHIEAGLRTFNMRSPFPEEFNRRTIASVASVSFAPTHLSARHLRHEGVPASRIFVTGNTAIDTARIMSSSQIPVPRAVRAHTKPGNTLILLTMHRRENQGGRMTAMYDAIRSVGCEECRFIVPVHPNPRAGAPARTVCATDSRFICTPPLSYPDTHWMLNHSKLVLTDSGGLQEESTWYHTPVLVLRANTERMEAVHEGVSRLTGQPDEVAKSLQELLAAGSESLASMSRPTFPFGDGYASKRIIDVLKANNFPPRPVILEEVQGDSDSSSSKDETQPEVAPSKCPQVEAKSDPEQASASPTTSPEIPDSAPKQVEPLGVVHRASQAPLVQHPEMAGTLGIVLQVYKRNHLQDQLQAAVAQSMKPRTIQIVQNTGSVDVSDIIKSFKAKHKDVIFTETATSRNLRFHGRFFFAYLMDEEWVSVWDDDVLPGSKFVELSIQLSKQHQTALVGASGKTIDAIRTQPDRGGTRWTKEGGHPGNGGRVDFVGHVWTLKRDHLRYFMVARPWTHYTGEDLQLSFALQQVGIETWAMPIGSGDTSRDTRKDGWSADKFSSFKKPQSERQRLQCRVIQAGFKPIKCSNCNNKQLVERCVNSLTPQALKDIKNQRAEDLKDNSVAWRPLAQRRRLGQAEPMYVVEGDPDTTP